MMATVFKCWWQNHFGNDFPLMLVTFWMWRNVHQHLKVSANKSSNNLLLFRHQHRCNHHSSPTSGSTKHRIAGVRCSSIFENFWCTLTLNLTLRSFYVSKKIFMLTGLSYRVNFPLSKIVKSPAVFNINLDRRDNGVEVTMFSCRMTDLGPFGLKNWWAKFAIKTSLIFSSWHIFLSV